jgi:hypothetical protein
MLANGGNGFLRIMTFYPTTGRIDVRTWSPTLNRDLYASDTPGDGAFTLNFDFSSRFGRWARGTAAYPTEAMRGSMTQRASIMAEPICT